MMDLIIGHYYTICGDGDVWVKLLEIKGTSGYFEKTGWKSLKQATKIPDFEVLSKIQHYEKTLLSLKQTVKTENVSDFNSLTTLNNICLSLFLGAKVEIYVFKNAEEKEFFVYNGSVKAVVCGYTLDTLTIKTENDERFYSLPIRNFVEIIGNFPYQSLHFNFCEEVESDVSFINDIQPSLEIVDLIDFDEEL